MLNYYYCLSFLFWFLYQCLKFLVPVGIKRCMECVGMEEGLPGISWWWEGREKGTRTFLSVSDWPLTTCAFPATTRSIPACIQASAPVSSPQRGLMYLALHPASLSIPLPLDFPLWPLLLPLSHCPSVRIPSVLVPCLPLECKLHKSRLVCLSSAESWVVPGT